MKVCGISIKKKRIHLSLVQHFSDIPVGTGPRYKLLKTQIIYIPKHFERNPLDISYKFNGNPLIKDADLCQIIYDVRKDISARAIEIKEIVHLILIDYLNQNKKDYYTESSRALKHRTGHRSFATVEYISQWLEKNLMNYDRIDLLGRSSLDTQKILSVLAGCSEKRKKGNIWQQRRIKN